MQTVPLAAIVLLRAVVSVAAVSDGVDLAALRGWDIVVAEDAIESEVFAAREFRQFYRQATGIELPMVRHVDRPDRHVFIGPGIQMRENACGFEVASFGQEDLRIVVRDATIAIAGGRPRGTLYGVYTFLEDYLGVRFLTAEHTYVPPLLHWKKVGPVDRFYHPPLDFRWVGYEVNYRQPEFATRLRLNAARLPASPVGGSDWSNTGKYGGRTSMRLVHHSFNQLLPPAAYAAEHPDYFCLFRGKRWAALKPGEDGIDFKMGQFPYGMQPCLTHPDVLKIVTKNALDELAARPDQLNVSVAQNDGGAHCQCDSCSAIDKREGATMGSLLEFVNAVADEVARERPDRMVSTLAYSDTGAPPRMMRPGNNVQVMWSSIGTCFIHAFDDPACEQNNWFNQQLRPWASHCGNLYTWNYYFNSENHSYQLPLPNLRLIGHNMRYQVSLGVRGMFAQVTTSCHGNEWEDLRNYLLSHLLWNPSRDSDQLVREWLDLHYGPGSPPIARWINRLHKRAVASGQHCRCLGGKFADYGLDESDARAGLRAFEEAMILAGDDEAVRHRVEKASICAYRAALEPIWYVQEAQPIDPQIIEQMRPTLNRFFELCRKHATRTAEGSSHQIEVYERRLRTRLGL